MRTIGTTQKLIYKTYLKSEKGALSHMNFKRKMLINILVRIYLHGEKHHFILNYPSKREKYICIFTVPMVNLEGVVSKLVRIKIILNENCIHDLNLYVEFNAYD